MDGKIAIIICIILLILILGFVLKEIFHERSGNFFINYPKMIGGTIDPIELPEEILKMIKVHWPQVSILSNSTLQKVPLKYFHYSEKTDGEHTNLLIYKNKIYNVTSAISDEIKVIGEIECEKTMILDTELYNEKYFIFDVVYIDEDLSKKTFIERMKSLNVDDLDERFVKKKFSPISSINSLLEFIKNDKSPETGNEIDGVILQRIDTPYFTKRSNYNIYKLKPRFLMSVDFKLIYNSDNSYDLYTIGSFRDFLNTLTKKPREVSVIYDVDGKAHPRKSLKKLPDSLLILFDSPFIPNLSKFTPNSKWNRTGYFKRIADHADYLLDMLEKEPTAFDGKIVEMSLTLDNQWVPIRIRDDKRTPNGFKIAQDNVSLIFDPIRPQEEIYFQKNLTSDSEMQNYVHKINNIFRKFIIETHINPYSHFSSIIDLCGGRGGDELNLYANGIVNFFAIDADPTALKQYIDRSYYLRLSYMQDKYEPLTKTFRRKVIDKGNNFSINALNHSLGRSYVEIAKDLNSRHEWDSKKGVDFILCNFAIHYICNDKRNLTALTRFVGNTLNKSGYFIFTYFDGDEILRKAKDSVAEIGPFKIQIIGHKDNITIAKMPLPSIQGTEDIYREEPLVHSSMLENISLKLVEEYNIYDKTVEFLEKIKKEDDIFEKLIEYYKLIKVRVYKL